MRRGWIPAARYRPGWYPRDNYTFEEVEEIRQDLDKIRRWYEDVTARDWFDSPTRDEAAGWIRRCEALLDAFEADVYARTEGSDQPGGL